MATQTDLPRDSHGRFLPRDESPIFEFKVNHPINAFRRWWAKVIGNEGVDIKLKIHPLTAIAIATIVGGIGFGFGRLTIPEPLIRYLPILQTPKPTPTPNPWRDTAFSGILRQSSSTSRFYLETHNDEAITLEVPANTNLAKYVGRRIFATGKYNAITKVLEVTESQDLEVLPIQPLLIPIPSPSPMVNI